ncbi:phospholipid/cholesterol/gamma-HCH transport system substrate-binding protein [Marmoricola sp. OAE513]|uniref:MCE family protein n=1 Tax=Marmoricola sp. OAE513 TaxID=2817894 RepID=UPI001AE3B250
MSTPFRERNPVKIGAASLLTIVLLILVAFKADSLPIIGGGDTYYAKFSDSSGLKPNDEVRIAGVRVGKVTSVELSGDAVKVGFKIKTDSDFGRETGAQIKVKTLLGAMFLALEPKGSGQLKEGAVIPQSRTRSAYDVVEAFSGLAERAEKINLDQLTTSLNTLAEATANTPEELKSTLSGLSALSANVAARDDQVNLLLTNLKKVSGVLADRNQDIVTLMKDGDVLLRAIVARREAVHTLLVSTSKLSTELTALVRQSRGDLKPALSNLTGVVNVLRKNQTNLDDSLRLLAPFYRVFTNTLGSGPWFDNWISNLPPAPALGAGG